VRVRRGVLAIVGAGILLVATPARATTEPPTAISLAKKLVKAGICTGAARVTDQTGTTAKCQHAPNFDIEIHAYATPRASRAALASQVAGDCGLLLPNSTIDYWVGRTWYAFRYPGVPGIGKVLGGAHRTYDCP